MRNVTVMTIGFFLISCLSFCCQATGKDLADEQAGMILAKDGKTDYVIKVSPNDLVANTAAKELATHLKAVTGAEFPIVTPESNKNSSHIIAVGPAATKMLLPELNLSFSKLGNDGIVMKSSGQNLVLTGAEEAKRGTLYAVYEFLETIVGIRWWTSSESYIPQTSFLKISPVDIVYVPKFWNREVFYLNIMKNGIFAARCRSNGEWDHIPLEYGGKCITVGPVHTFYKLLPPKKYFKEHPEWYSMKNGKRTYEHGSQLCLNNDEMRIELTKNALERLRKNPDAAMISISQNDGSTIKNGCDCAECTKLSREEASPSGPLINFVNKVAEDIEKEFPKVCVETLAYEYTRKPPLNIKPRRNVVIRLCGAGDPLSTVDKDFKKLVEEWAMISNQLFIWTYVTNFKNFLLPYPNLPVLAPNIRFFADNKTVGVFMQGDGETVCGDFVELRAWLLAHLMWNPSLDEKILIREFMDGYYGPASRPLQQYLEFIRNIAEKRNVKLNTHSPSAWLNLEDLIQSDKFFEEATQNVKDDPILSRRVRKAKISLDYVWIKQYQWMQAKETVNKMLPSVQKITERYNNLLNTFSEFKEKKRAERVPLTEGGRFSTPAPEKYSSLPRGSWIDVQECDFNFWFYGNWVKIVEDPKASNKYAARMPGNHNQWAVFYSTPEELLLHAYAVVRCDIKSGSSDKENAFTCGVYDCANKKNLESLKIQVKDVLNGEYNIYDLGTHIFNNQINVWFAPCSNPDVEAVYIDRIFFVKEKKSK